MCFRSFSTKRLLGPLGRIRWRAAGLALGLALVGGGMLSACPFCAVESQTLTEEIEGADVVVFAKLVKEATTTTFSDEDFGVGDADSGNATFEIVEVLRGAEVLAGMKEVDVVYFGEPRPGKLFMLSGLGAAPIDWTTPLPLSDAAVEHIRKLSGVAPSGADRLAYFQDLFEHEDPLLAQDAYDEFARAPYAEVQALGPRMDHDRLVAWIADPEVSPSRRRLYLTMLGVCGSEADVPFLEELIASDYEAKRPFVEQMVFTGMALGGPIGLPTWIELVKLDERGKKLGLDAMIACYLILRGPEGLDLIDERFLSNPKSEYTHVYSTIMALRFHGEESDVVPRERLLASVRLLLENRDFADQVIPDLARWEDWSVLDRLVKLFKDSETNAFIRQPVVTYLTVASEQPDEVGERASIALKELEALDPDAVQRARSLMAFGFLARARGDGEDAAGAVRPEIEADDAAGFGASGAETEIAEEDEPADIPDPTEYDDEGTQRSAASLATISSETSEDGTPPGGDAQSGETAADVASEPAVDSVAATQSVPVAEPDQNAALVSPSPLLIVGVPLLAAGLLMGLYWAILRSGAV